MSKTLKSVISICLVMVLVFGVFTAPIMQPKAEAIAITATSSMIAIGVAMLTMLGITFASTDAAKQASKGLIEGSKDIFDWIDNLSLQGGPNGEPPENWTKFTLGGAMSAGFATFVNKARQFFGNSKNNGSIDVPDENRLTYQNAFVFANRLNRIFPNLTDEQLFNMTPYGEGSQIVFSLNGVTYTYSIGYDGSYHKTGRSNLNGTHCVTTQSGSKQYAQEVGFPGCTNIEFRIGFFVCRENSTGGAISPIITPYICGRGVNSDGVVVYKTNTYPAYVYGSYPLEVETLPPTYSSLPYQNISPYELNIIYNALAEKLKTQEVTFDYTQILDQMNNNADQQLQVSQDQLLEQAQIKDLLEQIKAGQGGTGKTELQESELDIPEVPHDLTWKFPFCVPFDLIALVGALNATPKDPKWEIPFHIESLGFDDSIELDLTKFEPVTQVLRVVMTIFFLLGLTVVTRKMIKG